MAHLHALAQQVFKGGPGHPECGDPLILILLLQQNVLPPVLAGVVGSEAVRLVGQEADSGPNRGVVEPVVTVAGGSSCPVAGAPEAMYQSSSRWPEQVGELGSSRWLSTRCAEWQQSSRTSAVARRSGGPCLWVPGPGIGATRAGKHSCGRNRAGTCCLYLFHTVALT